MFSVFLTPAAPGTPLWKCLFAAGAADEAGLAESPPLVCTERAPHANY